MGDIDGMEERLKGSRMRGSVRGSWEVGEVQGQWDS